MKELLGSMSNSFCIKRFSLSPNRMFIKVYHITKEFKVDASQICLSCLLNIELLFCRKRTIVEDDPDESMKKKKRESKAVLSDFSAW